MRFKKLFLVLVVTVVAATAPLDTSAFGETDAPKKALPTRDRHFDKVEGADQNHNIYDMNGAFSIVNEGVYISDDKRDWFGKFHPDPVTMTNLECKVISSKKVVAKLYSRRTYSGNITSKISLQKYNKKKKKYYTVKHGSCKKKVKGKSITHQPIFSVTQNSKYRIIGKCKDSKRTKVLSKYLRT